MADYHGQTEQKVDRLQGSVDDMQKRLDWFLTKKYGDNINYNAEEGDENKERGNWTGKLDFLLSCLGYAVGLGNVWRFPYLCYKNGGGAFFIPYVVMLFCVGMPCFFLELSLGQFTSRGPIKCWEYARLFSGLGYAMVVISFLVAIYYNIILAWSIYYLFASFTSELPWQECREPWAGKFCRTLLNNDLAKDCANYTAKADGVCYNETTAIKTVVGVWNETLFKDAGLTVTTPANDYLYNEVLKQSKNFDDYGLPDWKLVLSLLAAWIIVFLCLIKGIKSSGRVVYFTATFPYVILVILLIRGVTLPGYMDGIKFYIVPDFSRLSDSSVWKDAAVQIFFSLGTSWGGLIALASYNKFHTNALRDAIMVSIGNCVTSVFAGFVIFSFLGYLAHELGTEVDQVAQSGVGLAFTVYPEAVKSLPIAPLWAILFFFMLIILGLDSQFVLVETCLTSIMDAFPNKLKGKKSFVLLILCVVLFTLGLSLTCPGGPHMLALLDTYSGGWNVLVIAIFEVLSIVYCYGFMRFKEDIRVMIGDVPCLMPWSCCAWWWAATWGFITPGLVLFVLVFNWYAWEPTVSGGEQFPMWAEVLGFLTTVGTVLLIFVVAIVMLCMETGTLGERFKKLTTPSKMWGPALVKHREEIKHVRHWDVDPWSDANEYDLDTQGRAAAPDDVKVHM